MSTLETSPLMSPFPEPLQSNQHHMYSINDQEHADETLLPPPIHEGMDEVEIEQEVDTGNVSKGFSLKKLWIYTGPGWLMSIAYLDPGNLESDLQAGAVAGNKLLWILLWAHISGLLIQILAARLGVVTGHHLAQLIREHYPRSISFTLWGFAQLAIIGGDIQEIVGTSIALKILIGLPLPVGVLLTSFDTFIFMLIQNYGVRMLEKFFMSLIGVMAVCFWWEMVRSSPNVGDVIRGIILPTIPSNALVQAVSIVGSVIMPHNMYLHSALVMSRKLGPRKNVAKLREANFYFVIESAMALFVSYLINLALVVVFGRVYFTPGEEKELPGLYDAGDVLSNSLGSAARWIWGLGLLAAGQSSTMTGTLSGQYLMEGFLGRIFKRQWIRIAVTRSIALVPSMLVAVFAVERFDTLGELLNVLQSICLPTVLIPIMKLASSAQLMGSFKTSRLWYIITWILAAFIMCINMILFVLYLEELPFKSISVLAGIIYMIFLGVLVWQPLKRHEEKGIWEGNGSSASAEEEEEINLPDDESEEDDREQLVS